MAATTAPKRRARRRTVRPTGCVGYGRYSTEKQGSLAEQDAINSEVAAEAGAYLMKSFHDEDQSRSIQNRPGLIEMFEYIAAHHAETGYIVVNELERLTAGITQRAEVTQLCQQYDIVILTEDRGAIDPFDEEKMQEADEAAVRSKGETLKVQRRTRRNLRQKVIHGTMALRPAYGTRMAALVLADGTELPSGARYIDATGRTVRSGRLEVHPDEIEHLRQIFTWADEGLSNDEIARRLNDAGVPTKGAKRGTRWRGNTIAGILDNPLYKGTYEWGKQAVRRYSDGTTYLELRPVGDPGRVSKESPLGPLVDPALWDRVHAARAKRRGERRMITRAYEPGVLHGLVYCARCGNKMYARNDRAGNALRDRKPDSPALWRFYCEAHRTKNGTGAKPGFAPPCAKVWTISEKKILRALASLGLEAGLSTVYSPKRDDAEAAAARAGIEAEIERKNTERRNAQRLAIQGKLDDDLLDEALADADAEIVKLEARLVALAAVPEERTLTAMSYTGQYDFGDLCAFLTRHDIPVADRTKALRLAGVDRLFVDGERVEVELVSRDASVE